MSTTHGEPVSAPAPNEVEAVAYRAAGIETGVVAEAAAVANERSGDRPVPLCTPPADDDDEDAAMADVAARAGAGAGPEVRGIWEMDVGMQGVKRAERGAFTSAARGAGREGMDKALAEVRAAAEIAAGTSGVVERREANGKGRMVGEKWLFSWAVAVRERIAGEHIGDACAGGARGNVRPAAEGTAGSPWSRDEALTLSVRWARSRQDTGIIRFERKS